MMEITVDQCPKFCTCPQAEVRGFQHDGLHLQARSQKYGKVCSLESLVKHLFYCRASCFTPKNDIKLHIDTVQI